MDYKLILTTFGLVFLAELGDKTQLASFCLAADTDSKLSVFIGSAVALVISSLLAVVCGGFVARLIPPQYIKIGAGVFFIIVGIWTLFARSGSACSL